MKDILCPVCKTTCGNPINSYTVSESASHVCPPSRNSDRHNRLKAELARLWPEGKCDIYRCKSCGFGFGYPFVGGSEQYYQILHEQMGYPGWRWDYDIALECIDKVEPGKILDIGAGVGKFLERLPNRWEKFAVESSISTIAKLNDKGIEAYQSIDEIAAKYPSSFTCVTLFQALEHISEFEQVLATSSSLLESGGYIVITVPDADAMFKQEEIVGHADMPPNHINKWTVESLTLALKDAQLEVISSGAEKKLFKNVKSRVYMRILADSNREGTIASNIYKLENKRLRILFLAPLAALTFIKMARHFSYLLEGGAIFVVARKNGKV